MMRARWRKYAWLLILCTCDHVVVLHGRELQENNVTDPIPSNTPSVLSTTTPTIQSSNNPSVKASNLPSRIPSSSPSSKPSVKESNAPSAKASSLPSMRPSSEPSLKVSNAPSGKSSNAPSKSSIPTDLPSVIPTSNPTSIPTMPPSMEGSNKPSTSTQPTVMKSIHPTSIPTSTPSIDPSMEGSDKPSTRPTVVKSIHPTSIPTSVPTIPPSIEGSNKPSISTQPTVMKSIHPTSIPSSFPTTPPSIEGSNKPSTSARPTVVRSIHPTSIPTSVPTISPSIEGSSKPSISTQPTVMKSIHPTSIPSSFPTTLPSLEGSNTPSISSKPSVNASSIPTIQESSPPSFTTNETMNLHVSYYEAVKWVKLPSGGLANYNIPPYKSEKVETINYPKTMGNFAGSGKSKSVAALFTGHLQFESVGVAWLCLISDDGSKLFVDDLVRINNDGIHKERTRCGTVSIMEEGAVHKISVEYFQSNTRGSSLELKWRQPGVGLFTTVPSSAWMASPPTHMPTSISPTIKVSSLAPSLIDSFPPSISPAPSITRIRNVEVRYFEAEGWTQLPAEGLDSTDIYPYSLDMVQTIDYPSTIGNFATSGRSENVAALFIGYLQAESKGVAWFCLKSSDGSKLYVNNELKVNNDGIHEPRPRCGAVNMVEDVIYKITVEFFQNMWESLLELKWRAPGTFRFTSIPSSSWLESPPTPMPTTLPPTKSPAPSTEKVMNVQVSYFEAVGWTSLPPEGLESSISVSYRSEMVETINYPNTFENFAGSGRSEYLAALFVGFMEFESSGEAWFCMVSNDGSRFYVDEELIINNDGIHDNKSRCGIYYAKQKDVLHKITLEYFQSTGSSTLELKWRPPGESKTSRFETIESTLWTRSSQTPGPSTSPTISPSYLPSSRPSNAPSSAPTIIPTIALSMQPSTIERKNLHVDYFEAVGWTKLPDDGLSNSFITPYKSEMVDTINYPKTIGYFAGSERSESVAVLFTGHLRFESMGVAWFCIISDDGSKVFVDDELIIDNDGIHVDRIKCQSIQIKEESTIRKISVEYFQSTTRGSSLILRWRQPKSQLFSIIPPTSWMLPPPSLSPTTTVLPSMAPSFSPSSGTTRNINVDYYEAVGWDNLPVDTLSRWMAVPYKSEMVETINYPNSFGSFAGSERSDNVAALFEGNVQFDTSGIYWFCVISDDGSKIYINDELKIDNDGVHEDKTRCDVIEVLEKGTVNKVTVEYFQRSSSSTLILKWRQPRESRFSIIPSSSWVGSPPTSIPTTLPPSTSPAPTLKVARNVEARYYEAEDWKRLPLEGLESSDLYPYRLEMVETIDYPKKIGNFAGSGRSEHVAALFKGFVQFETEGLAWLCVISDDGSKLYVNDELKISNDGVHQSKAKCGSFRVYNGDTIKVTVEYFQYINEAKLVLKWRAPGQSKFTTIPPTSWI